LTSSRNFNPDRELFERVEATGCYQYAADALAGRIVVCKKVKQSAQRFMDDLDRNFYDPKYSWVFDVDKAYRPINFIEKFIKPTKGDYDAMRLLPWQHFVEGNLYGWVDKRTKYRRFREGIVFVGSGNGKSTLITGDVAYAISKDDERGAEAYCLANSKQQATAVYVYN